MNEKNASKTVKRAVLKVRDDDAGLVLTITGFYRFTTTPTDGSFTVQAVSMEQLPPTAEKSCV